MALDAARSPRPTIILTRRKETVCPLMHKGLAAGIRAPAVLARQVGHRVGVLVLLGTARFEAGAYTVNMQRVSIKAVMATLWVFAVTIAGIAVNVNSFLLWTVLAAVAIVPPIVMRWWNEPRQSMSQSIQEALR